MRPTWWMMIIGPCLLTAGCGRWFSDSPPNVLRPAEVKQVTIEVIARGNRCEPAVIALDRQGRAVLVTFQVTSVGKEHIFLIPDLAVRRHVPADTRLDIQVLAARSGIFEYACNSQPWIGPFATAGKLAVK